MTVLANPTTGPRIVPYLETRSAFDFLPNGHPAFRVTQPFSYKHDGIDLGNFNCGDAVLASIAGTVTHRIDSYGALIAEVHSGTAYVGYGHLSRYGAPAGSYVSAGMTIGYVGDTGLDRGGCHLHFSFYEHGMPVDPFPLLEQNQALTARPVGDLVNFREGPGTAASPAKIYAYTQNGRIYRAGTGKDLGAVGTYRRAKHSVKGFRHGIGKYPDQWLPVWLNGGWRHIARPLALVRGV